MRMMTKRAVRAAMRPALLGAEEARRQRTAYGFADTWLASRLKIQRLAHRCYATM